MDSQGKPAIVADRLLPLTCPGPNDDARLWRHSMQRVKQLLSSFAVMLLVCGTANAAEPVKIRVSWIAPITNWASLLLEKKELARHQGRSYVLEPVRYVGTPQMITALANGELE